MEWRLASSLFRFVGKARESTVYRLAALLGDTIYYCVPRRKQVVMEGIRIAFGDQYTDGEAAAIARSSCHNFFKSRFDFLRVPTLSREDLFSKTTLAGQDHLTAALRNNRGALLVSAHIGCWEMMGARLAAEGFPITVVSRPRSNPLVTRMWDDIQSGCGMKVLSKFNSMRALLTALRGGEVVGILPDQYGGKNGLLVEFFGRITSMHPVVPLVAQRMDVPVLPCVAPRDGNDVIHITIYPPLQLVNSGRSKEDLRVNTEMLTRVFEDHIREYPDQWLWLHRRWRETDLKRALAESSTEPPRLLGVVDQGEA